MKTSFFVWVAVVALIAGVGCSSPSRRVEKNRAAFDTYPAETQAKIRAGDVAVGFTEEQVTMALGKPDRIVKRTDAQGPSQVWIYGDSGSRVGLGLGMGFGGGGTSVGTGAGVSTGGGGGNEKWRLVLAGGRVTSIERAGRG